MFKYDMKMIKIFETERLQGRINFNLYRQNKFSEYLKKCIVATFAIPLVTAIATLFLGASITPL